MGIFDQDADIFSVYRVGVQWRDKLMGGTPRDPKIIEGWLRSKAGIDTEAEIKLAMARTLQEQGVEVDPDMDMDAFVDAVSAKFAAAKQTTGFKSDENGLYIEGRTLKACLRECIHILYAGEKWANGKGPKGYAVERFFVNPDRIYLGVMEPDGVEMRITHSTVKGQVVSSLNYTEYVLRPGVTAEIMVLKSAEKYLTQPVWKEVWRHAQENGWGSVRSQGYGRFDVVLWEKVA